MDKDNPPTLLETYSMLADSADAANADKDLLEMFTLLAGSATDEEHRDAVNKATDLIEMIGIDDDQLVEVIEVGVPIGAAIAFAGSQARGMSTQETMEATYGNGMLIGIQIGAMWMRMKINHEEQEFNND